MRLCGPARPPLSFGCAAGVRHPPVPAPQPSSTPYARNLQDAARCQDGLTAGRVAGWQRAFLCRQCFSCATGALQTLGGYHLCGAFQVTRVDWIEMPPAGEWLARTRASRHSSLLSAALIESAYQTQALQSCGQEVRGATFSTRHSGALQALTLPREQRTHDGCTRLSRLGKQARQAGSRMDIPESVPALAACWHPGTSVQSL